VRVGTHGALPTPSLALEQNQSVDFRHHPATSWDANQEEVKDGNYDRVTPLSDEEKTQLAGILRCQVGELDAVLASYATAALEEYTRMFIGQRAFTRGADIQEHRLFLLIKEPFENQIPDEQRVSNLFQTTATQSRSLIQSVMSKYQYELQDAINSSLTSTVQDAPYWDVLPLGIALVRTLERSDPFLGLYSVLRPS
jgi:hypothetical protein